MEIRFRPLPTWPYLSTPDHERRSRWTFKATWGETLALLERELGYLDVTDVEIEAGFQPRDIRADGWPRSDARVLSHPGVALHFDTEMGHLRYATDVHLEWQHNVRGIALGLQALRAVDRYGITQGREQYRGFAELPSGMPMGAASRRMNKQEAADFLKRATEYDGRTSDIIRGKTIRDLLYKTAAKTMHPDHGGEVAAFQMLTEAKAVLDE